MKNSVINVVLVFGLVLFFSTNAYSGWGGKFTKLWSEKPELVSSTNGVIKIPIKKIDDGKAHHFRVTASDGTMVTFFLLKSKDGVVRAAVDACDVCYKAGLGYTQSGDFMVCRNCGQKFASTKINVIKGGCNPAPLERRISGENVLLTMKNIDENAWYCKFQK